MTASSQHQSASAATPEGLRQYYVAKIEGLQLTVAERNQNLRRLQAQRNELNAKEIIIRSPSYFLARTRLIRG